jgi:hypothetical protein
MREKTSLGTRFQALQGKYEDHVRESDREIEKWKYKAEEGDKDNVELREYINGMSKPSEPIYAEDYYTQLFDGLNNRYPR